MKKETTKPVSRAGSKSSRKPALKKKTVAVLTDRSIVANLTNTRQPIVIISMGCATDFTRQLPTLYRDILLTDITRPAGR